MEKNRLKITFYDTNDIGGFYYQSGYQNRVILSGYMDRPAVETNEETVINGYGEETIVFSRHAERIRFEVADIADSQLFGYSLIRRHDTITVEEMDLGDTYEVADFRFESRPQLNCLNIGVFSFEVTKTIVRGCDDDNYPIT